MKNLNGKTALVTGGASGIGKLVALDLAARGMKVVVWDVNAKSLNDLTKEAKRMNLQVVCMNCDVSNRKDVYAKAKLVKKSASNVDVLINNAGIVSGKEFMKTTDEEAERTMRVNTLAHFWTVRAFLQSMLERDSGHIVTIASAGGLIGVAGLADYCASKFAAFGFHESVRMELRKKKSGVRTTIVCPYFIDTGMFSGVATKTSILLPILKPENVAGRIVEAIIKDKKRVLIPWTVYTTWILRLLPVALFDFAADFLGLNDAMNKFKGRR